MFEELFLKRLTQLRLQKGVSAREMSLAIGQSAGYINGIENGRSFPSMEVFFYICEYLNVHPKDFFDSGMENPNLLHGLEAVSYTHLSIGVRIRLNILLKAEKEHLGIPFTRDLPTRWRLWIIGAIKKKL